MSAYMVVASQDEPRLTRSWSAEVDCSQRFRAQGPTGEQLWGSRPRPGLSTHAQSYRGTKLIRADL